MDGRKNSKKIQFCDSNGKILKKAEITFNQIQHEFLFGCNAFVLAEIVKKDGDKATENPLVRKFLDVFNYATLPFYIGTFEKEEGKPITSDMKKVTAFLNKNDVVCKGHPLCWHTVCAPWLLKYDNKTILEKQLARIRRDVGDFKDDVGIWDAINEVVIMPYFDRYDNAVTRICREYGQINLVKMIFDECHKSNPDAVFLINDFNMSEDYEKLITKCLDEGIKINAIGLQSHQHQGYWGLEKLNRVLTRFEKFGLPIHFTENTFVSGELVPPEIMDLNDFMYEDDATTPEGEERQALWLKEFYTEIFEKHPMVKAITNWDFSDGAWLNAPSGLLRRDGIAKPAYFALKELVKEKWHSQGKIKTDENGFAEISGFKGKYEWSCNSEKGKFVL